MLKRTLLPLLIGTAVLLFGAWQISGFPEYVSLGCPNQGRADRYGCVTVHVTTVPFWYLGKITHDFDKEIIAVATAVVASFTILLAYSTVGLWNATNQSIRVTENNLRVLERAYVFGGPTNIRLEQNRTKTFLQITVDNPGRTPAILRYFYGEFSEQAPLGDTPKYDRIKSTPCELVLNSSVGINPTDPNNMIVLPAEFRSDVTDPHFFWGYIEYADIFKTVHTSRFCTMIYPANGKFQLVGPPAWNDWD